MKKRNLKLYVYTDVSMLLIAKIVAYNIRDNIAELSKINPKWDLAFIDAIIARIEDAINNYLGYDVKKELRDATSNLTSIMSEVKTDLGVFKRLVNKFFKDVPAEKAEILNVLGFKKYSKTGTSGTQNGLIKLLFDFKTNLNDTLRKELISRGIMESLLDNIIANASKLEGLNNTQEVIKGVITEKANFRKALFNDIYREVSGICIIASSHYKNSPAKSALFNFSKIAGSNYKNSKPNTENSIAAEHENDLSDDVNTLG